MGSMAASICIWVSGTSVHTMSDQSMRGIISGAIGIRITLSGSLGLVLVTTDPTAAAAMALSTRDEELIAEVTSNVGTRLDADYVVNSVSRVLQMFF